MLKHVTKLVAVGLAAATMAGPAQATLIGDTYNLDVTLTGDYEFLGGGQFLSATPTAPAGAGGCIIRTGTSQVCSPSGLSWGVGVGASSIDFSMFGSTGGSGTITWAFTGLDFSNPSEFIIDVTPSSQLNVSVIDFGSDFVTLRASTSGFVGAGFFGFTLVTAVPEPASVALLALGLVGVAGAVRRRS